MKLCETVGAFSGSRSVLIPIKRSICRKLCSVWPKTNPERNMPRIGFKTFQASAIQAINAPMLRLPEAAITAPMDNVATPEIVTKDWASVSVIKLN